SASMGRKRSRSWPSTVITKAALARPGPIAAATSAPVAPLGSVSAFPSGKVMAMVAGAADITAPNKANWGGPWPAPGLASSHQFYRVSGANPIEREAEKRDH